VRPPVGQPTHIPGLDVVLAGGLLKGGAYLICGPAGTGKTTLGNHLAFNHVRAGGKALYTTTIAESHADTLLHVAGFAFFAPELAGEQLQYLSLYDELQRGGLEAVTHLLRRMVRERGATLLIIDGAGLLGDFVASELEYRRLFQELRTILAALGCTWLLLSHDRHRPTHPLATHVDGIIHLEDRSFDLRDVRFLHIQKMRGIAYLRGRHEFEITREGIVVYPRLETTAGDGDGVPAGDERAPQLGERCPTGVQGLDEMLRGGLGYGSTTLVTGAPGVGKTTLGLHFIAAGAARDESGLVVTFHEVPHRVVAKADALGLGLGQHVARGHVQVVRYEPTELLLDHWAGEVIRRLDELRPRRLLLDGLTDVQNLGLFPRRLPAFLAALRSALRARGVTAILTQEANTVIGSPVEVALPNASATVDTVIALRYVELRSQLRRSLTVVKLRDAEQDVNIREFVIGPGGIQVGGPFGGAEAVLTGVGRLVPD
jgi:circadian clock protein KaiC